MLDFRTQLQRCMLEMSPLTLNTDFRFSFTGRGMPGKSRKKIFKNGLKPFDKYTFNHNVLVCGRIADICENVASLQGGAVQGESGCSKGENGRFAEFSFFSGNLCPANRGQREGSTNFGNQIPSNPL